MPSYTRGGRGLRLRSESSPRSRLGFGVGAIHVEIRRDAVAVRRRHRRCHRPVAVGFEPLVFLPREGGRRSGAPSVFGQGAVLVSDLR